MVQVSHESLIPKLQYLRDPYPIWLEKFSLFQISILSVLDSLGNACMLFKSIWSPDTWASHSAPGILCRLTLAYVTSCHRLRCYCFNWATPLRLLCLKPGYRASSSPVTAETMSTIFYCCLGDNQIKGNKEVKLKPFLDMVLSKPTSQDPRLTSRDSYL